MKNKKLTRQPPSLALRLTLLFGLVTAVVFSGFGWITERSIKHHFDADDISELELITQSVEQVLTTALFEKDQMPPVRRFDDILVGHHHASLYIVRHDGYKIFTSSASPDLASLVTSRSTNDSSLQRWSDGEHTYRVLIRRIGEVDINDHLPYTMAVAVPIDSHLRFLDSFHYILWIMIAGGIAITSLMGWIAIRRGHAPLRKIVTQIHRISAKHLQTRLHPETVPRELSDLAVSFNEMLDRMEGAFLRLSHFSADIAHELRTPVTNLMTQTQVALSQTRTVEEYHEILYSNIEEYERMAQMIGDMLFLAQSDNGLDVLNVTEVNLSKEIQELFDYYEAWAEERHVSLTLEGDAMVSGDRLMLRRALGNLLSNAIRHTPSEQSVHVNLTRSATNDISISVENPGDTISPEHIPRLFDRFYRVDPSRQRHSEGSGLGLAIVKSIIDAHKGKIEVTSSEGNTRFQITLH